jgi:hypothetical protein
MTELGKTTEALTDERRIRQAADAVRDIANQVGSSSVGRRDAAATLRRWARHAPLAPLLAAFLAGYLFARRR